MSADKPEPTAAKIRESAIRLLAGREHSRRELARKLHRRYPASEPVDAVLDQLAAENLQSDERFTGQYVAMRVRKGYGPLRIRAELQERGIDGELVELGLEAATDDWRTELAAAARNKFGATPPPDRREGMRRARFLEYRGFPPSLIRDYLAR